MFTRLFVGAADASQSGSGSAVRCITPVSAR